ncbi:hypothetical protein [Pseudomonas sp. PDM13]|uniref:hypothetical protein n=1 Tax=Pseudomonas sp. PDM13 TaxID=2769255 RepID=UPI0021E0FAB7|nr:hypothetical protein [Pseudomonas sp. PDM13]MCU9948718.1 hypothetical protein [Pseudomonas sp. PDM13]
MRYALALPLLLAAGPLLAQTLETRGYRIEIIDQCEEGTVGCDNVLYRGTSKKSGNTLELKGRQLMRMCADGVTPCHSLGYEFNNGDTHYFVSEDGHLSVTRGERTLVDQQGEWR